ncbi:hypothetical protein SteCoe_34606 [Stentor coeruleus]|uniref:Uncharacterized protein n=1 Tax=Stentor coeruleus TaxID=5963 RepID=A0A1R2AU45_9CILI|nr:hypothetical protein SteCoe_34606 [Stentor coeruleus]
MDNAVLEEGHILSRNYSSLRTGTKKWRSFKNEQPDAAKIHISKDPINSLIFISRNGITVEGYKSTSLHKRSQLRRNFVIFKSTQYLWELLNPFKLIGISEKVYHSLYMSLYQYTLKDNFNESLTDKNINLDKKQDFGTNTWLTFSNFYDGFFEFIDSNTNSKSAIEYIRLIKTLTSVLQDMKWSLGLNLYGKLHIPNDIKANYHPWMMEYIKSQDGPFKKFEDIPNLIKQPNDIQISERLLVKRPLKPVDRENFNVRKLEQMMNLHLMKEFKHGNRGAQSQARFRNPDKKTSTYYSNYLEKISPLSSVIKHSRSRQDILEKVIKKRKGQSLKTLARKKFDE